MSSLSIKANTLRSFCYLAVISSTQPFPYSYRGYISHRHIIHLRGGSSLFEKVDESQIKTGWVHNQPKRFKSVESENNSEKEELRTGWLHNTKATKQENKVKSQEKEGKKTISAPNPRLLLVKAMKDKKLNHRIISTPIFHAVGEGRRCVITEHKISVPLDRYNPPANPLDEEPMIDLYFSIVELVTNSEQENFFKKLQRTALGGDRKQILREQKQRAADYKEFSKYENADDCIIYLQGGPGFGAPEPINGMSLGEKSSWAGAALSKGYKKIILMDQRGTGKSNTITKQTLQKKFPDLFALDDLSPVMISQVSSISSVEKSIADLSATHPEETKKLKAAIVETTNYMAHFRADNIVKDAEDIKDALLLPVELESEVCIFRFEIFQYTKISLTSLSMSWKEIYFTALWRCSRTKFWRVLYDDISFPYT